jgi:hypothetical protein
MRKLAEWGREQGAIDRFNEAYTSFGTRGSWMNEPLGFVPQGT